MIQKWRKDSKICILFIKTNTRWSGYSAMLKKKDLENENRLENLKNY